MDYYQEYLKIVKTCPSQYTTAEEQGMMLKKYSVLSHRPEKYSCETDAFTEKIEGQNK